MLKWFSMKNFKKGYLPIGHEISLSKEDYPITPQAREHMNKILYTSIVGSIMYAMICTRSNMAYSLEIVISYQSDLRSEEHTSELRHSGESRMPSSA